MPRRRRSVIMKYFCNKLATLFESFDFSPPRPTRARRACIVFGTYFKMKIHAIAIGELCIVRMSSVNEIWNLFIKNKFASQYLLYFLFQKWNKCYINFYETHLQSSLAAITEARSESLSPCSAIFLLFIEQWFLIMIKYGFSWTILISWTLLLCEVIDNKGESM